MQNGKRLLGSTQLFRRQDVGILQTHVVGLVEETLALHASHVENVQIGHRVLQTCDLGVGDVVRFEHIGDDVARHAQLFRRDQYKLHTLVARHGRDQ